MNPAAFQDVRHNNEVLIFRVRTRSQEHLIDARSGNFADRLRVFHFVRAGNHGFQFRNIDIQLFAVHGVCVGVYFRVFAILQPIREIFARFRVGRNECALHAHLHREICHRHALRDAKILYGVAVKLH